MISGPEAAQYRVCFPSRGTIRGFTKRTRYLGVGEKKEDGAGGAARASQRVAMTIETRVMARRAMRMRGEQ